MAIHVVHREASGVVILRDVRETGVAVLLACQQIPGIAPTGGTVYTPSAGVGEDETFPMIADRAVSNANLSPQRFRIEVDMSAMPPGLQPFAMERFVERAVEAAQRGEERVELTPYTAHEWGYGQTGEAHHEMWPG
jgi:hypothetical protein